MMCNELPVNERLVTTRHEAWIAPDGTIYRCLCHELYATDLLQNLYGVQGGSDELIKKGWALLHRCGLYSGCSAYLHYNKLTDAQKETLIHLCDVPEEELE